MVPSIVGITGSLIGKYDFDDEWKKVPRNPDEFLEQVQAILLDQDVKVMKSETLGRIFCSIEAGDGVIHRLGKEVPFSGGGLSLQRWLVARALAYIIRDRLDEDRPNPVAPKYRKGEQ